MTYAQSQTRTAESEAAPLSPEQAAWRRDRLPKPVTFGPADKADNTAAQAIVRGQIAALQKKNYLQATQFWASGYSKQPTPQAFALMLEKYYAYEELQHAQKLTCSPALVASTGKLMVVFVTAQDAPKAPTTFSYELTREMPNGADKAAPSNPWRIIKSERGRAAWTDYSPLHQSHPKARSTNGLF